MGHMSRCTHNGHTSSTRAAARGSTVPPTALQDAPPAAERYVITPDKAAAGAPALLPQHVRQARHVLRLRVLVYFMALALALVAAVALLLALPAVRRALLPAWLLWALLCCCAAVELLLFPLMWLARYRELNRCCPQRARPRDHDALQHFAAFLALNQQLAGEADLEGYLRTWFMGAPLADIRRGNVEELFAYGFFYDTREALVASGKGPLLAAMVEAAEKLWALSLPPGTTPGLPFMAHLWQPLRCSYRPAAFYVITELLTLIGNGALLAAGFAMHRAEGFQYFTYGMAPAATTSSAGAAAASGSGKAASGTTLSPGCPTSTGTPLAPLLFLHGVGLGCVPYLDLLLGLAAGGRPLLAPQYTHVSLRWTRHMPSIDDIAHASIALLRRHGYCREEGSSSTSHQSSSAGALQPPPAPQPQVIAHSFGTFVATRLLQLAGPQLGGLALLDPVCCGMFMPQLLATFVYRSLGPSRDWRQGAKRALLGLLARDLHTSATFCRGFFWTDVSMWPGDAPPDMPLLLALHGRDELLHAAAVVGGACMDPHPLGQVLYHPDYSHADFLLDSAWQDVILAALLAMPARHPGGQSARQQHAEARHWREHSSAAAGAAASDGGVLLGLDALVAGPCSAADWRRFLEAREAAGAGRDGKQ